MAAQKVPNPSADLVRTHDRDRWLTAALAPAHSRPALLALFALNVEITRIPEIASEPMVALIRHRWWREQLAQAAGGGELGGHPLLAEIAPLLRSGALEKSLLDAYLDARETGLDGARPADGAQVETYCRATGGALCRMAAGLLGADDPETLAAALGVGTAHGLIGRLYNAPWWAERGRPILPGDGPAVAREIAARAGELLAEARARRHAVSRAALPALLIGPITSVRIRRLGTCGFDPAAPRAEPLPLARPLALLKGALTGRY